MYRIFKFCIIFLRKVSKTLKDKFICYEIQGLAKNKELIFEIKTANRKGGLRCIRILTNNNNNNNDINIIILQTHPNSSLGDQKFLGIFL